MIDPKLKDKTVIVTGANHGIGAATAISFAKQQARVFINYFRPSAEAHGCITDEQARNATEPGRAYYYKMQTQSADEVVKTIEDSSAICYAWEADLSDPENIPKLFDKAEKELGPYGITVNVISPGAVQTGWIKPELEKQIKESYPLKRMGRPEDIADAIIFLASEQADWITGQVLYVGGGNKM